MGRLTAGWRRGAGDTELPLTGWVAGARVMTC
jgi:hypothetical protein